MKVKCIYNDNGWFYLTIGKVYEVINIDDAGDYLIMDDDNDKLWYLKKWFKPLSEIRIEKIDKLLR
jgi:hypothetical protein